MKLVIIESAAKKKTLSGHLTALYGPGQYKVMACLGHIRDLPPGELGVAVDAGFQPTYEPVKHKTRVIKRLSTAVAEADELYLATDPDREGEAIAWHIVQVTRPQVPVYRVAFHELTREAVRRAFAQPRSLAMDLVAAQEGRRVLDRLVGYKVSPALWRGLDNGQLSAGRVQSAALQLVVDRQRAIENFVPQAYWRITARFAVPTGEFTADLIGWQGQQWTRQTFPSAEAADAAVEQLKGAVFRVAKIDLQERQRKPPAPFITSTLQQAASTTLQLSPARTMKLAQELYEQGHITYLRTDTPAVSDKAADLAETLITEHFGDVYLPADRPQYRAPAGAQEAHECIRPTDLFADDLGDTVEQGAAQLYRLIWQRFVASQMAAAVYDRTTIYVKGGPALFLARSERLLFDGFLRVYDHGADVNEEQGDDTDLEQMLPAVTEQQTCQAAAFTPKQQHTRPPATFSEASLVRQLETLGIGRPSTYSLMVATIRQRKYVKLVKRRLVPTPLGMQVAGFLAEHFGPVFNADFTCMMEQALDKIAAGELDTRHFLTVFWQQLAPLLAPWTYDPDHKREPKLTDETCPVCNEGKLAIREGKKGKFLGCVRYPQCKYARGLDVPPPVLLGEVCPECGAQLCIRARRDMPEEKFVGCCNFPHCRYSEDYE